MANRVIMVRESVFREMREALAKCAEGWGNAVEFDLLPPRHHAAATYLRDEARATLAKAEGAETQPVAHAYVIGGEIRTIDREAVAHALHAVDCAEADRERKLDRLPPVEKWADPWLPSGKRQMDALYRRADVFLSALKQEEAER